MQMFRDVFRRLWAAQRECDTSGVPTWNPVLRCDAVCCSVLQYVAVCSSMLQYVAVCCSVIRQGKQLNVSAMLLVYILGILCCGVVLCVAMCCSVLQFVSFR